MLISRMKLFVPLLIAVILSSSNFGGVCPTRPRDLHESGQMLANINAGLFNVDTFGATADGKTDNSKAFAAAWKAACAANSQSVVSIPRGKYLLNPISFQGPCTNHNITVQVKGELISPTNKDLWNGEDSKYWVQFKDVNGLTFEGGGSLDGQGSSWWSSTCKENKHNPCKDGPTSLRFTGTTDIVLRNINSINSKQIHIDFDSCDNVEVYGLNIRAPGDSPNTDGIHLQRSSNIKIRDITVGTGDDCISIGSGSSNLLIDGVTCGPGHGISIGSLGQDPLQQSDVKNVTVNQVSLSGTQNGLRIKTWQGGKGFATDFTFQKVTMKNVQNPIIIDQHYCPDSTLCSDQESGVKISGVSYESIRGTSATKLAIIFNCSESIPCEGIRLQNVHLSYDHGKETANYLCENAQGSSIGVVEPPVMWSNPANVAA